MEQKKAEEQKIIEELSAEWEAQQEEEMERLAEEAKLREFCSEWDEHWTEKWDKTDPNASPLKRFIAAFMMGEPDPNWVE